MTSGESVNRDRSVAAEETVRCSCKRSRTVENVDVMMGDLGVVGVVGTGVSGMTGECISCRMSSISMAGASFQALYSEDKSVAPAGGMLFCMESMGRAWWMDTKEISKAKAGFIIWKKISAAPPWAHQNSEKFRELSIFIISRGGNRWQ